MRQLDKPKKFLPRQRPRIWVAGRIRSFTEGALIGLMIGLRDTFHAEDENMTAPLYLVAGLALGFRNAGRASWCWPPLGVSLFVAHLIEIHYGAKPPFVEANFRQAMFALHIYGVVGLGLLVALSGESLSTLLGFFVEPPALLSDSGQGHGLLGYSWSSVLGWDSEATGSHMLRGRCMQLASMNRNFNNCESACLRLKWKPP